MHSSLTLLRFRLRHLVYPMFYFKTPKAPVPDSSYSRGFQYLRALTADLRPSVSASHIRG